MNKQLALRMLYNSLPTIECKRLCQDCCGPLILPTIEEQATGLPHITILDLPQMAKKVVRNEDGSLSCPKLKNGGCSIYRDRPMICRVWGLTEDMKCPFGCVPSRWLTKQEVYELLSQVEAL